jgi:dienelactone hydrolase
MRDSLAHSIAAEIPAGSVTLHGDLWLPPDAEAAVIFAHGMAGSRHNPRHQRVASLLHEAGLATLLVDLLAPEEEPDGSANPVLRTDVHLLAQRLRAATRWLRLQPEAAALRIGYFGASTGAAAAIIAAAAEAGTISAVVSRGGLVERAGDAIDQLRVPTLLVVGGNDATNSASNLETWARLRCTKSIEIIPGAGHLFAEPGALDNVAALAVRWFGQHLRPAFDDGLVPPQWSRPRAAS